MINWEEENHYFKNRFNILYIWYIKKVIGVGEIQVYFATTAHLDKSFLGDQRDDNQLIASPQRNQVSNYMQSDESHVNTYYMEYARLKFQWLLTIRTLAVGILSTTEIFKLRLHCTYTFEGMIQIWTMNTELNTYLKGKYAIFWFCFSCFTIHFQSFLINLWTGLHLCQWDKNLSYCTVKSLCVSKQGCNDNFFTTQTLPWTMRSWKSRSICSLHFSEASRH